MNIHLIAIGGAVMHNLALELRQLGHDVTGSDDEIYEPARSRLAKAGLLPSSNGWEAERIDQSIDLVILGMHARLDNPELKRAQELNLPIQSFPEFIAGRIKNKIRIVVSGSHGKTTTTSMIMHVLRHEGMDFDYLVGGQLQGFDRMVRLSEGSQIAVIEGDEYLSSRLDPRPKMWWYDAHLLVITGIAWDHMNVFPTKEDYERQFEILIEQNSALQKVFWYENDPRLSELIDRVAFAECKSYTALDSRVEGVESNGMIWPLKVFGDHNMANLKAALLVSAELGVESARFFQHMASFEGSAKRLELVNDEPPIYRDFAHAPSKVKATVQAIRKKYKDSQILSIVELHTYSSLNRSFLPEYFGSLADSDMAIVFFDPHAIQMKRLASLEKSFVSECFNHPHLIVIDDPAQLQDTVVLEAEKSDVVLLMSSGNLGGLDIEKLMS